MPKSPFADEEIGYDPFDTAATNAETSAEKAISQESFREMVQAAEKLDPLIDLEMKFLLYATGRLGMRKGEVIHMDSTWLNTEENWIEIPKHEKCEKGKDGGVCGYCKNLARQMADYNDADIEECKSLFWKAKTVRASRCVPYSFHEDCAETVELYFEKFDEVRASGSKLSRKVKKAADLAGIDENVSPHGLRATAAMNHVESGIDMWALQSIMGWAYPNTARRYVLNNSKRTRSILEERH